MKKLLAILMTVIMLAQTSAVVYAGNEHPHQAQQPEVLVIKG